MIISTVLAGNGDHHVSIRYWSGHNYPTAAVDVFGARLIHLVDSLMIGNGDFPVVLDMTRIDEPFKKARLAIPGEKVFSAPVVAVHKKLEGIRSGQRVDVRITTVAARDQIFPRSATQEVMHTKRVLHGPGPYPETTRWGKWINGYRAEAAARAAARASGFFPSAIVESDQ